MKLIIAEKPSVARAIASAVGATDMHEGYIEGGGNLVSWCRGHLVDLAPPDRYPAWSGGWRFDELPMIPSQWIWEPSREDGAADQYRVLKELMSRADIESVVNACDADREGEGIFRRVFRLTGCEKPVLRFWSTSLVPDAILSDLAEARPETEYDGLADAAEGRAKWDWLIGLNATRAYSSLYDARLPVGRVQTALLNLIVERTRAHAEFTSTPFWQVRIALTGFNASSEKYHSRTEAESAMAKVQAEEVARVDSLARKRLAEPAPKLYDLTGLQADASTRCGLTAAETLRCAQELYEAKLLTYPRSDSTFITTDDAASCTELLGLIARDGIVGKDASKAFDPTHSDVSRIVDDERVSGHGAIMPTRLLDPTAMARLGEDEKKIAQLVCCRLLSAVMEPAVRIKSSARLVCGGVLFDVRGSLVVSASWIDVEKACGALAGSDGQSAAENERERPEAEIPEDVSEGDEIPVRSAEIRQGKSKPPRLFTDATLLAAMVNAGRSIEDADLRRAMMDDSSHSGGLGTPATRAAIIEKVLRLGFAQRKGRTIESTREGEALIDTVADSLKSAELTASWESQLAKIERGEASLSELMPAIENYARTVVADAKAGFDPSRATSLSGRETVGACPLCGQPVIRRGGVCSCSSNRDRKNEKGIWEHVSGCGFKLFGKVAGKVLTTGQIKRLLAGETVQATGLKSRKNTEFCCGLRLGDAGHIDFVFDGSKGARRRRSK